MAKKDSTTMTALPFLKTAPLTPSIANIDALIETLHPISTRKGELPLTYFMCCYSNTCVFTKISEIEFLTEDGDHRKEVDCICSRLKAEVQDARSRLELQIADSAALRRWHADQRAMLKTVEDLCLSFGHYLLLDYLKALALSPRYQA